MCYLEKHIGIGEGTGKRIINPQTYAELAEGAVMEMDTVQIKGVDSTRRVTRQNLTLTAVWSLRKRS